MRRLLRITAILMVALLLLAAAAYTVAWFVTRNNISQQVSLIYQDIEEAGFQINGPAPTITGFPGPYNLKIQADIKMGSFTLIVPSLSMRGFPIPNMPLEISFDEGLSFKTNNPRINFDNDLWSLDSLYLKTIILDKWPQSYTVEGLRTWRDQGGKIDILELNVDKDPISIASVGHITLDESLQIAGILRVASTGHIAFMGYLQNKNIIKEKKALIAGTILESISAKNPETGIRTLETTLTIQNRKVLIGPLELFAIPEVSWPYDTLPAPRQ